MFGVELASGAALLGPSPKSMIARGASFPPLTLQGEPWRLGSSMFLHFGLVHTLCARSARWVAVGSVERASPSSTERSG